VPLHQVFETACPAPTESGCEPIPLSDLQQTAQVRVRDGFAEVDSLEQARADVRRLRTEQMLPPCPRPEPSTTAPTATGSVPTDAPASGVQPGGQPTGSPGAASVPTLTGPTPSTVDTGLPGGVDAGQPGGLGQPSLTTTPQTPAQIPGKDCRQAG
jgi:protein phosphatase